MPTHLFQKGRAKTGGKQKGTANKRTREVAEKAAREGLMPLEVQLRTMQLLWDKAHETPIPDLTLAKEAAAVAAQCSPYCHPRLHAIEAKVEVAVTAVSIEERRQSARQAILEAFAERPALTTVIEHEPQEMMVESVGSADGSSANPLLNKTE